MKKIRSSLRTAVLPGLLALLAPVGFAGCSGEEATSGAATDAESADRVIDGLLDPPPPEVYIHADVREIAQPVARELMQTLSQNLQAAMAEGGAVGAMEFCNVQAIPLTTQVSEEQGMTAGRTSDRVRNPSNAPDSAAAAMLDWYTAQAAGVGGPPVPRVQELPDGDYRFYQPLVVQGLCLQCHGADDQLGPGVADALADLYPADQATGYAEGDLRGLLHVTVPASTVVEGVDPVDR